MVGGWSHPDTTFPTLYLWTRLLLGQHFVSMLCEHLDYGPLLPEYPGLSQAEVESNAFTLASTTPSMGYRFEVQGASSAFKEK